MLRRQQKWILLLQRQQLQQQTTCNSTHTCTERSRHRSFVTSSTVLQQQEKERVVVLGTGWGGFNLALNIDQNAVNLTIISPRNHFVFTPLLPSVAVGTLELRCIQEPIRSILKFSPTGSDTEGNKTNAGAGSNFIKAKAQSINVDEQTVLCKSVQSHDGLNSFEVPYDRLVIAIGVKTNTFGIQSIEDGALGYYDISPNHDDGHCIFYLKQLAHARAIRANIIDCFERASLPTVSTEEKKRLLSFIIVGGGPTSCEFTAELHGTYSIAMY
jgi:NADH dehydrogenase FAD-containing subunit